VFVLALAVACAAGCGHAKVTHFGELRVTERGSVKLHRSRPPAFPNAPARNIADIEFLTPSLGFLTSSKGQFDHEPGRIQRSTDGGRAWHDVWTGRDARLDWIAFADRRHGFVGGDGFILRTTDGGSTWRRSPMSAPHDGGPPLQLEPTFVTPSVGFAVTDPSSFAGPVFVRTTDGGLHWRRVRGLRSVDDVDFVSRRVGFALGTKLYRTNDGGATWHPIGIPNVPYSLVAVDFLDARRGFLGGGYAAVLEKGPSQAVFATTDGGRTWQRRYVNPHHGFSAHGGDPFARLRFVDGRRGWATTGLCKCCPSGPCAGTVYVTRDGGYTWRRRGTEVQLTTVGADDAWATPRCDIECDVLWRTTDAGRTWRPIARPDRISLSSVVLRRGAIGLGSYDGANFVSPDGGRTWRVGTIAPASVRASIGERFYPDETCGPRTPFVEAGRTLHVVSSGTVFEVANLPVSPASVALASDLVAVVGLRDCHAALALGRKGRWSVSRIPRACQPSVGAGGEIWLACDKLVLHSSDGGRTWSRFRAPLTVASIGPDGLGKAWIVAANRLWRTDEGGESWTEVWPRLSTRG
jgi:photosystem II stability/assembly factor-like uncharacterized protein